MSANSNPIAGAILPLDPLVEVLSHLTPKDAWIASQTCRWWHQLITRDGRLRAQILRNEATEATEEKRWHRRLLHVQERASMTTSGWAAEHGYLPVLQWLHASGLFSSPNQCIMAAASGEHFETLQWLHTKFGPTNNLGWLIVHQTVGYGQLEVLKWLLANDYPRSSPIYMLTAATEGQLEVLKWLHTNGFPWDAETCKAAASGGQLEVLQWLRANGCPWDGSTIRTAELHRHLEVAAWARANGCPEE